MLNIRFNSKIYVFAYFGVVLIATEICWSGALEDEVVAAGVLNQWGYRLTSTYKYPADFCDPNISDVAGVTYQGIKSLSTVPDWPNTYYRYTLIKEVYSTEKEAMQRLQSVKSPPPATIKYSKFCHLRLGMRRHQMVYIVATDVLAFSKEEMNRLLEKLKQYVDQYR